MKLFSLIFFMGSLSFAVGNFDFKCRSKAKNGKLTQIKLQQLSRGPIGENIKVPYELSVETLNRVTLSRSGQVKVYRGLLETEDVVVNFESFDKKVNLNLYLDELDQTILSIKGQTRVQLECDEHRW